jgi:hypothetical protein
MISPDGISGDAKQPYFFFAKLSSISTGNCWQNTAQNKTATKKIHTEFHLSLVQPEMHNNWKMQKSCRFRCNKVAVLHNAPFDEILQMQLAV